jgi:glycosyltransferase involved in cell wall biosynthesis
LQYIPWLEQAGLQLEVLPLVADELLRERYVSGSYGARQLIKPFFSRIMAMLARSKFDVVWIEKEALPWFPLWFELALLRGVPYILDYDDAVFHHYDSHPIALVRHIFGSRLDGLMSRSAMVVGGNSYLAQRARNAGARRVEVVPTVIDLERYPVKADAIADHGDRLPSLVWIGSPATVHYLQVVADALRQLAERVPFVLRVIGGEAEIPGVQVELIKWTEETEVTSIAAANVGIMPLLDSPWERGKCGYKLIQYMACGLPVVASAVGVNSEIVEHGGNGFLASTQDEWVSALERLLVDQGLRKRMGKAGRHRVESMYCIQKTGPLVAQLLRDVAQGGQTCAA